MGLSSSWAGSRGRCVGIIMIIMVAVVLLPGLTSGASMGDPRAFYRRLPPAYTAHYISKPDLAVNSHDTASEISPFFLTPPSTSWFYPGLRQMWKPSEPRMDADLDLDINTINEATDGEKGFHSLDHRADRPHPRTASSEMFSKDVKVYSNRLNKTSADGLRQARADIESPYSFFRMMFP